MVFPVPAEFVVSQRSGQFIFTPSVGPLMKLPYFWDFFPQCPVPLPFLNSFSLPPPNGKTTVFQQNYRKWEIPSGKKEKKKKKKLTFLTPCGLRLPRKSSVGVSCPLLITFQCLQMFFFHFVYILYCHLQEALSCELILPVNLFFRYLKL